jgi:hypothetical protein
MLHRDAASSDLERLSHFFRELLCDPGLRGCFRDFLAQEHLAEHMALFWVEAEHIKRAVQRFNRSLKNFGSADVDVRTLYTEAVCKCDDLCKRFLHEGAMHTVATWVEADTRYDVFAALKRLHTIAANLQAAKEAATASNGQTGNVQTGNGGVTAATLLSPGAVKYSHTHAASASAIENDCSGSAQTAAMHKLSDVVDIAQTKVQLVHSLPTHITVYGCNLVRHAVHTGVCSL